jgi:hypothetical protein
MEATRMHLINELYLWKSSKIIIKYGILSVTLNFTQWPWVGFIWKASPYYLVWRVITICSRTALKMYYVVARVHVLIDLEGS